MKDFKGKCEKEFEIIRYGNKCKHTLQFYSEPKRAMNRFEIKTSEKLGTPGIEEMSQAWGWKVPTLASTGIKLRPTAAAARQQHI